MPRPPSPIPFGQDTPFRVPSARELGITRGRLRASDLEHPFRGVRIARALLGSEDSDPGAIDRASQRLILRNARAYALVMPPHAFYAGLTAVALHGLPLPDSAGARLEGLCVAVHSPARAVRGRGVDGIRVAPGLASVSDVDGLRVSSPASTWAMLADQLSLRELVILGDAIVRVPRDDRGRPRPEARLATLGQLQAAARAPWRRGRPRLEAALASVRVGSMSPLETDYRLVTVASGLPQPHLDVEVRDAAGRLLGISDAVYAEQSVIAEVEGDHHRTLRAQWDRDIQKYAAYAAHGWEVIRLTSRHIRGPAPCAVQMVHETLLRRGWQG